MVDESGPLLIDRASPARSLEDAEVRAWAEDQRVFISSVMDGYAEPREAAARAIQSLGATPVMFERFGGRDSDPEAAYLAEVESSGIYVGLLGERYGRPLPSRYSATHAEYRHAEERGLRLSVWSEAGANREGPQQSFLEEVRAFNVTGQFGGPEDLEASLRIRLLTIAAEELSPWVKIGRSIFRAKEIGVGGGRAHIRAVIRDADVADSLAALDDRFGARTTTIAYWDGIYDGRLTSLSLVSRAGGSREMELEFEVSPPQRQNEYGFNGVSYAEATKIAIEVSWFGEANPFGLMSSMAEIGNPFSQLAALGVAEESYRPIAFLLAYEILARERNVGRVRRLRVGPSVAGERRVEVEWSQPSGYTGQAPTVMNAEGAVAGG
jgi:Domain of unknown function (DUF4062)